VLLSITFDPEHDQPDVLAKYVQIWKANADGWHFLTGDLAAVKDVCGMFGMNFWPADTPPSSTVKAGWLPTVTSSQPFNSGTSWRLPSTVRAVSRKIRRVTTISGFLSFRYPNVPNELHGITAHRASSKT